VLVPIVAVAGLTAACSASPSPAPRAVEAAAPAAATTAASTITATGTGSASGTPDLLTVTIGVETNGPAAKGVLATNNAEATALIGKLEADGVAAKDIQTSQLSLNPVYANDQPPRLTGYQADDTVTVRFRQLDKAGAVLDDAVAVGGNDSRIQWATYSVEDTGPLLAAARADAVRQAVAEAKAMAAAAGVTLGPIKSVTDASAPQVVPFAGAAAASAPAAMGTSVPVQPGTEDVTADVSVTYAVS
jgi:uncharacterized protein